MTLFIIISSIIFAIIILVLLGLLTRYVYNKIIGVNSKDDNFNVRLTWKSIYLLIIAFILIASSFIIPLILTQASITESFDFSETGQIGDTIGGIMNPFIALAGVIVTGLAFYMQYKANLLQRKIFYKQLEEDKLRFTTELNNNKEQFDKQFASQENQIRRQQFEAQFYEMLRLHKENVNEIELYTKRRILVHDIDNQPSYKYETFTITKRNAFVELKKEFEFILLQAKNKLGSLNSQIFHECYEIFFWGLKGFDNDASLAERIALDYEDSLQGVLAEFKDNQYSKEVLAFQKQINFEVAAFDGHSEFLGHYYRHLFHTVKFVVSYKDILLNYDEIRNYLRVLRAQLSNHEQIMLFYNWLSGFGGAWENNENNFFTEYVMIHNLWYDELFDDIFIADNVKLLRDKPVNDRKTKMFEID